MIGKLNHKFEVGLDEAGRGCWWGPVVAGAVIWPENLTHQYLTDSKKLSEKKRNELYPWIKKNCYYGIGYASSTEIDKIGIVPATKLAMNNAIKKLEENIKDKNIKINSLIIDGIGWKENDFQYPLTSIIKGDGKYYSIAAASILAKVYRDNYCLKKSLEENFKKYKLEKHKGYGTKLHKEILDLEGPSIEHRFSFKPICNLNK